MMHVIAIASQKGGAGKTTLAIHLATFLSMEGNNTVLVDLDPQASASGWSDRRDRSLPVVVSTHAKRLRSELDRITQRNGDVAVLDTAPHSDQITLEAMRNAHLVVIPTRPSILDIDAISSTLELSRMARKKTLIVMNACMPRGKDAHNASSAISELKVTVCPARLTQRAIFARALLQGKTAMEVEPSGKASAELREVYTYVIKELKQLGEHWNVRKRFRQRNKKSSSRQI